ncbi:hypothetical protein ACIPLC_35940 [Kitasatospora sp. NPDC086801]|uniref:hypothetical protein n=1 Tax=Kitasatospora sp. NPDC086801 TaxID=3364066 RepID=UPI0037F70114
MCLMVWIGTEQPVPPIPCAADPHLVTCYCEAHEVAADAPVRARFASPHVTYVGSHEGCGCGFDSSRFAGEGFTDVADAMTLIDAMRDEEREEFLAQKHSREFLAALVSAALPHGTVDIYVCWAGDEDEPPDWAQSIETRWLTEHLTPLQERVKYTVFG